jgi:hypothetical protein
VVTPAGTVKVPDEVKVTVVCAKELIPVNKLNIATTISAVIELNLLLLFLLFFV